MLTLPRMDLYTRSMTYLVPTTCIVLCLMSWTISFGPTDKTRREGEDDVIFICPTFRCVEIAPVWAINGLLYGSTSLPYPFEAAYDNLLIPRVHIWMDQFKFQCFLRDSGTKVTFSSSIGTLTVTTSLDTRSSTEIPKLTLNHRFLQFNEGNTSHTVITWHYSNGEDDDCIPSDVFFRIRGWQCPNEPSIAILFWERIIQLGITETTINSSNSSDDPPDVITLEAISNVNNTNKSCASLGHGIQISESAETREIKAAIGGEICVPVPVGAGNVLWPMIPTNMSTNNACECPLNLSDAGFLEQCNCIDTTSYMITLQIVDSALLTTCLLIHDVREEVNGVHVYFFNEKYLPCFSTEVKIYREYLDSYWISVELPAKPSITFEEENDIICFNSESPTGSPIQYFELSIFDVAEEREYYKHLRPEHSNCTLVAEIFNNSVCGPFRVELKAYNENGHSPTLVRNVTRFNGTGVADSLINSNICECIMSTVLIDSIGYYDTNNESAQVQVTCNRTYSSYLVPLQNMSELVVNITLYEERIQAENIQGMYSISCSEQIMVVIFGDLKVNKSSDFIYTIERRDESSNDNCILLTKRFNSPPPPKGPGTTNRWDITQIILIVVGLLLAATLIIFCIIIIYFAALRCKKKRCMTGNITIPEPPTTYEAAGGAKVMQSKPI